MVRFGGTRKNFDAVCAVVDLLAHSLHPLSVRFNLRHAHVFGVENILHVKRYSAFRIKWLADSENPRPFHLAAFYAAPNESRVVEKRTDVKDSSESPTRQHLLKL